MPDSIKYIIFVWGWPDIQANLASRVPLSCPSVVYWEMALREVISQQKSVKEPTSENHYEVLLPRPALEQKSQDTFCILALMSEVMSRLTCMFNRHIRMDSLLHL